GFGPRCDDVGQGGIWRLVREVLLAGEEPQEGASLPCELVANRAPKHGITLFQGIENRPLGDGTLDVELNVPLDPRKRLEMVGQHDSNHGRAWASTDKTAGRSRKMGVQLSPASAEA